MQDLQCVVVAVWGGASHGKGGRGGRQRWWLRLASKSSDSPCRTCSVWWWQCGVVHRTGRVAGVAGSAGGCAWPLNPVTAHAGPAVCGGGSVGWCIAQGGWQGWQAALVVALGL